MITAWAEENGVDLSPSALAEAGDWNDRQRKEAQNHPLSKAAEEYAFSVNRWFENELQRMEVFSDEASGSDKIVEHDESEDDYVRVIRWYQFFIAVKLTRGFFSRIDEEEYPAAEESPDSNGSVKAALIGIDRSLSAWKVMLELHPENADSIQKFLFDLETLRLGSEHEFPRARDFIRPGFDEDLDTLH